LLNDAGVSFKIYASQVAFALLMGQTQSTLADFFADAAAGTLPQVAWVDPVFFGAQQNDEHPPANPQGGQQFVESLYNAMVTSPNWSTSALIVTYDEHGGFYDHVPPPKACVPDNVPPETSPGDVQTTFNRYGFRVPLIVASPWARPGYVSHEVYDLTSVLRLIEARFDLPALTARDANATPITDLFDFSTPQLLNPPPLPAAVIDPVQQAICDAM
jgi:phospholipase C